MLNMHLLRDWSPKAINDGWDFPTTIVYNNAVKDEINILAIDEYAKAVNKQVDCYYCKDFHQNEEITNEDLVKHLRSLPTSKTKQCLRRLPLVVGMKIIVLHNFDVKRGVVNGSVGVLRGIHYQTNARGERHLTSCVVELDGTKPIMKCLLSTDAPLLPDSKSFDISHPYSRRRCNICRIQVPIQPGYAITAHRSQGMTYQQVVIDLCSV
jgi:hypothetical protein